MLTHFTLRTTALKRSERCYDVCRAELESTLSNKPTLIATPDAHKDCVLEVQYAD
jgi:hypothetical protein